jgi:antitoxin YefM
MAHLQTTGPVRSNAPASGGGRSRSTHVPPKQYSPHNWILTAGRSIDRNEHPVIRSVPPAGQPFGQSTCGFVMDRNHQRLLSVSYLSLVQAVIRAYAQSMQTLPISKVKDKLNELVDAAASTREQVTITKNGSPAAVLIGVDEWESIQESLFWLSQPGIRESIAEAESDVEEGRVYSEEQIRAEFNVPKGDR